MWTDRFVSHCRFLLSYIYRHDRDIVFGVDLRDFRPFPNDLTVVRQEQGMTDPALHDVMQRSYGWHEPEMQRRRQLGDVCYMVFDGPVCVHFSWVTQKCRAITEVGFEVTLNDKNHWIYHCYTAPTHRGRSIYPRVLRRILEDAKARGADMAWIDAPPENRTSLKGISAAGFVEVATLERKLLCRWFTYQRYRAIVHAPLGKFFKQLPSRWTNFS